MTFNTISTPALLLTDMEAKNKTQTNIFGARNRGAGNNRGTPILKFISKHDIYNNPSNVKLKLTHRSRKGNPRFKILFQFT